jgi:hypothetical protein
MNYATKALETFVKFPKSPIMDFIIRNLNTCEKFLLPHPREIHVNVDLKTLPFIKMPYEAIAFEFGIADAKPNLLEQAKGDLSQEEVLRSTKRIGLAFKKSAFDMRLLLIEPEMVENLSEDAIILVSVFEVEENNVATWSTAIGVCIFDPNDCKFLAITDESYLADASYLPYKILSWGPRFANDAKFIEMYQAPKRLMSIIAQDTVEEMGTIIKAIVAINARNTTVVDIPASEKLNKKRLRAKKLPFFSYKTVNIFLNQSRKKRGPFVMQSGASTLKLGTVRGHFKVRKEGVLWWRDHFRGRIENGFVDHDYKVRPTK